MIVVDASAALSALLNTGPARQMLSEHRVTAPHLIDSEIANALRRNVRTNRITAPIAAAALNTWQELGIRRAPATALLPRIWQLRDNLTAYDATYIALAEALNCSLITADTRLSTATGPHCPITLIPK